MSSLLATARFCRTVVDLRAAPPDHLPEVAFVGRSNAGKSTALNVLCRRRRLAFFSRTPGRTQALNFFEVGPESAPPVGHLVDTPGYGFASTPQAVRKQWEGLIGPYLQRRNCLRGIVLMLDSRRGVTALDRTLMDFMPPWAALLVLLTKADKLTHSERLAARREVQRTLAEARGPDAALELMLFSAPARIGIEEAADWVARRLVPPEAAAFPEAAPQVASPDEPAAPFPSDTLSRSTP